MGRADGLEHLSPVWARTTPYPRGPMMVSRERPDHSWSLAIRTSGGVESNVGIAPFVQEASKRRGDSRRGGHEHVDRRRRRPDLPRCMLHAAASEKVTSWNRYTCVEPTVTCAGEAAV